MGRLPSGPIEAIRPIFAQYTSRDQPVQLTQFHFFKWMYIELYRNIKNELSILLHCISLLYGCVPFSARLSNQIILSFKIDRLQCNIISLIKATEMQISKILYLCCMNYALKFSKSLGFCGNKVWKHLTKSITCMNFYWVFENVFSGFEFVVAMKFSTENIDNFKILFIMILYVWALIQI